MSDMDECRKSFEEWAKSVGYELEPGKTFIFNAYEAWQAAWNARTEAKVSGEAVELLRRKVADSYKLKVELNSGDNRAAINVFIDIAEKWAMSIQLPAPQSPVVPGVETLWKVFADAVETGKKDVLTLHRLGPEIDISAHLAGLGVQAVFNHLLATVGKEG